MYLCIYCHKITLNVFCVYAYFQPQNYLYAFVCLCIYCHKITFMCFVYMRFFCHRIITSMFLCICIIVYLCICSERITLEFLMSLYCLCLCMCLHICVACQLLEMLLNSNPSPEVGYTLVDRVRGYSMDRENNCIIEQVET